MSAVDHDRIVHAFVFVRNGLKLAAHAIKAAIIQYVETHMLAVCGLVQSAIDWVYDRLVEILTSAIGYSHDSAALFVAVHLEYFHRTGNWKGGQNNFFWSIFSPNGTKVGLLQNK
jgi:hypothetical protein